MQRAEIIDMISVKESIFTILYFILYMVYLFAFLENENAHWVTLVIIPLILIFAYHKLRNKGTTIASILASVGIVKANARNGIGLAVIIGLEISILQLAVSESATKILEKFTSSQFIILMPLIFIMMLVTAGFTEEFFFRGILQTRLAVLLKSKTPAIIVTAICFGIYHLPYAFLSDNWATQGDFSAALLSSLLQGGIGGLILGWLYEKTDKNLIACIIAHSLINTLPGMTMIHFGG